MLYNDLDRFFRPRSIAIVGASKNLNTLSGQPLKYLLSHGYKGQLYPISLSQNEILGVKCYTSIEELPEIPDLALILVGSAQVADMLRRCGKRGVPFAIVFGSGYSETGPEGRMKQQELTDIGREYRLDILGPNCQGMVNIADGVYGGFGSVLNLDYAAGRVSMASQSGGFGFCIVNLMSMDEGLHFRQVATTGNEAGMTVLDFIDYYIGDPQTDIIVSYIEGLKDAHRLVDMGQRALRQGKPIMAWKVGNTQEGQKAVSSHTANLGGAAAYYQAAFRQSGIIELHDMDDLLDYCKAFEQRRLPKGDKVAIVTVSGGAGIVMTDACAGNGLEVPALAPHTLATLREFVPSFGSLNNPIDVTATIINDWALVNRTLRAVMDDPGIDSIVVVIPSVQGELAAKVAAEIGAVFQLTDKPLFVAWSSRQEAAGEAYAILDKGGVPRYKSPVRCARALAMLSKYAEARRRHQARGTEAAARRSEATSAHDARAFLAGKSELLTEHDAKQLLARFGIGVTQERVAASVAEAQTIASEISYPVAVKAQSPDIPHKTEAGVVRLNVQNGDELAAAYECIMARARAYKADARIDGALVQEMVRNGIEAIIGVVNDDAFGPVVMFGLGGIFTEVLNDVSFRVAPVDRSAALEMIAETKGSAVLNGARGMPPGDIDALADAIVKLSYLALDLRDVVMEVDVNPLFVLPKGHGVRAGDALIRIRRSDGRA